MSFFFLLGAYMYYHMAFLIYITANDNDRLVYFLCQHRDELDPVPSILVFSVSLYGRRQKKLPPRIILFVLLANHRSWTFNPRYATYWT